MIFLGIDLGSSSIKVSLFDSEEGVVISSGRYPDKEQRMQEPEPGWAEQDPEMWWRNFKRAYRRAIKTADLDATQIKGIGISYQMHGLVTVNKQGKPIRPAIIWCDSRAVPYGKKAFNEVGKKYVQEHLLNSPGNFTAAKLAWMKDQEPDLYEQINYWMLPGDYIAYRLSGQPTTTASGLSEGVFWDFKSRSINSRLMDFFEFNTDHVPGRVPSIGEQGVIDAHIAKELGMDSNIKLTYRAGDQPNNAFSLNVNKPGEVAATAGTSGVIYGVTDQDMHDPESRINTFLHVNDSKKNKRNGILICMNGTGILYSWLKKILNTGEQNITYETMNKLVQKAKLGAAGLKFYPFGNGAERILGNKKVDAHIQGIDFNIHRSEHIIRAGMEGIIYALRMGFEIMQGLEFEVKTIKAGHANLFLSEEFRRMFVNITQTPLELYDTDGASGAARGAALGYGAYKTMKEAFSSLQQIDRIEPDKRKTKKYETLYKDWKRTLPVDE